MDPLTIRPGLKLYEILKTVINHTGDLEQGEGCFYEAGNLSFIVVYVTTNWLTELCARVVFAR